MSLEIRRRKKMQDDPMKDDAVDLSGIPDDATESDITKQESLTSDLGMDTNRPKDHDDMPSSHQVLMEDSSDRAAELEAEDPKESYAMGGSVGGRGAIAGGSVPKRTT